VTQRWKSACDIRDTAVIQVMEDDEITSSTCGSTASLRALAPALGTIRDLPLESSGLACFRTSWLASFQNGGVLNIKNFLSALHAQCAR
jgi:hypothetical protein